jgi:hypothetical protein
LQGQSVGGHQLCGHDGLKDVLGLQSRDRVTGV